MMANLAMKINEQYLKYYMKKTPCLHQRFKLVNTHWIDEFFRKNAECKSSLTKDNICIFNTLSLTNILRKNESNIAFLDESEKTTAPFTKLKDTLFSLHKKYSQKCLPIIDNLASSQYVFAAEYPNNDNTVYGLVGFEFTSECERKMLCLQLSI